MVTKIRPPADAVPYRVEIATRFSDVDVIGHINNVAMSAVLEDARVRYAYWLGIDKSLSGDGRVVLASVQVDYMAEAQYPAPVEVRMYLGRLGRTSWETVLLARQGELAVAASSVVQVYVTSAGATPLPERLRAALLKNPLSQAEEAAHLSRVDPLS